jgi:hypothetical protein
MTDISTLVVLLAGGLAIGFLFGQRFSMSYRQIYAYRRLMMDTLKQYRSQITALRRQIAEYETPPEVSGLDINAIEKALGLKLPSWVKPLIKPYIDDLAKNPDKIKELVKQFTSAKPASNQTLEVWS